MEKVGLFKRIGIAIAKPKEYYKLANQKVGNTVLTFLLVSFIQAILLTVLLYIGTQILIAKADIYIEKIPDFTLSNVGLNMENVEPTIYTDDENTGIMVFDPNTTIEEQKDAYANEIYSSKQGYLLFGKDGVIVNSNNEIKSLYFSEIMGEGTEFTRSNLLDFYATYVKGAFVRIALIFFAVFMFICLFILKLLGGLIYSLVGLIAANAYKKVLPFGKVFNIAMYAGITTTILGLVLNVFNFPYWTYIKIAIIVLYIVFGVKYTIKNENEKESIVVDEGPIKKEDDKDENK